MTNPERTIQPAAPEMPKKNLQIVRLIAQAIEIAGAAPTMTPDDLNDTYRLQNPGFKISGRNLVGAKRGIELDYLNKSAYETRSSDSLSITLNAEGSFDESVKEYSKLYDTMLHAAQAETRGYHYVSASRLYTIGGQLAEAGIELVQAIGDGRLQTSLVKVALHRYLKDDGRFVQSGTLSAQDFEWYNGSEMLYDEDGHCISFKSDEARTLASTLLPHDSAYPLVNPLDIDHVKRMLG